MEGIELNRKSLLSVQLENLQHAERKMFINRMFYIGEHSFDDKHKIAAILNDITLNQMPGTFLDRLSGFLLYYDRMFCVLVEGTDEDIHFQIKHLIKRIGDKLTRSKVLITVHHILKRTLNDWISYNGIPPTLPDKIDITDEQSRIEATVEIVKNCTLKLYNFGEYYSKFHKAINLFKNIELLIDYIPEIEMLDYLLESPHLETLAEFHAHVEQIGLATNPADEIWPVASLYMPYNCFNQPYRAISVLPDDKTDERIDGNSV